MVFDPEVTFTQSMKGNFFQSVQFYKIMHRIGWKTFVIGIPKKEPALVAYAPENVPLYSELFPRFQVFYGPAVGERLDSENLDFLLKNLCCKAKRHGALCVHVRTPFPFPYGYDVFRQNGFDRQLLGGEYSVLINLENDVREIWRNMKRFARRCVKKALQNGVKVEDVESEEQLRRFYDLYIKTGHRRRFYPYPYSLFEAFWKQLEPNAMVKFFIAYWKKKPIAGILNTFHEEESVPYISCSSSRFWKLHPNHLLFWHSMLWSKEVREASIFKLYHVSPKRETLAGIDYYTFKTCFGGLLVEECAFYHKIISPAKFKVFQVFDKLPKSLVQRTLFACFPPV